MKNNPPIPCSLMIKNCGVVQPDFTVLENAAIAVDANRIAEIGEAALAEKYRAAKTIDGKNKLAMPGMYDCHTHTVQQLLKGGTVDEPPIVWRRILVPYESKLNEEDRYQAARLYCVQALKAGITMFADAGSMDMTGTVRAVHETGIRAAITRVARDLDPDLPACMCDPTPEAALKAMETLYHAYNGSAGGKVSIWFSISSPMSSSAKLVRLVAAAARQYKTGVHIHLGEHPAEVQACLMRWGMRPPEFLDHCGLLNGNVIAAHCIQVTDFDLRLMAERGLHVIHCPTANLPTQGIPKLLAERAAGINIALGNDGASSARQDILGQAQLLKYVTQAVYGTPVFEPVVLPLREAFAMATRNGAKALGVLEDLGTLEAGKKADIVLLDLDSPSFVPTRNLMNTVMMVASAQDVSDVIIDGEVIVRNRELTKLDEQEILYAGKQQLADLLKRSDK